MWRVNEYSKPHKIGQTREKSTMPGVLVLLAHPSIDPHGAYWTTVSSRIDCCIWIRCILRWSRSHYRLYRCQPPANLIAFFLRP